MLGRPGGGSLTVHDVQGLSQVQNMEGKITAPISSLGAEILSAADSLAPSSTTWRDPPALSPTECTLEVPKVTACIELLPWKGSREEMEESRSLIGVLLWACFTRNRHGAGQAAGVENYG